MALNLQSEIASITAQLVEKYKPEKIILTLRGIAIRRRLCFSTLVLLALAAAGFQLVLTNSVAAVDVTIGWDPNSEAELSGYGVYYQKNPPNPPYLLFGYVTLAELADPNYPTMKVTGLDTTALYQFAVTAFDNADNESCFSSPVCVEGGNVKVAVPCPTGTGGGSNGGGSGGGSGCFIRSVSRGYKTSIENREKIKAGLP